MVGGRRVLRSLICPMSSPLGGNPKMIPLSECVEATSSYWRLLTLVGPFAASINLSLQHVLLPFGSQLSLRNLCRKTPILFQALLPNKSHQHRKHIFIFCSPQFFVHTFFPLWQVGQQKPTSQLPQLPGPRFGPWKCAFSVPWNPPPLRRHPHPRWLRPCSLNRFPKKRTNIPLKNAGTGTFPFEMVCF